MLKAGQIIGDGVCRTHFFQVIGIVKLSVS